MKLAEALQSYAFLYEVNLSHTLDPIHSDEILDLLLSSIVLCKHLTIIHLAGNGLTRVSSDSLSAQQKLQILDLSKNKLASIPAAVTTLPDLSTLDMRKNKLARAHTLYPILRCPKLKYVSIAGNPIREKRELKERLLGTKDAELLDVLKQLEARKHLQQVNSLSLMVLGDGEAGKTTLLRTLCGEKKV